MKKNSIILAMVIFTSMIFSACSNKDTGQEPDIAAGVAATLTKQAYEDELAIVRLTQAAKDLATSTPEPVVHVVFPEFSSGSHTFVTDISSEETAPDKNALGDYFQMNKLERPFNTEEMEYFGDLDITRVDLKSVEPWFYATMNLVEDLRESGDIYYSLELDLDADGRGDFLIRAALPPEGDWTTDGVQVLEDQDDDIGGVIALHMEDPNPDLTGYETVVFDSGIGENPDLAWIRRDPEAANQIQFAFLDDITGKLGYLWSAWADAGLKDPGLYDYNDQYTYEQAGSPSDENINYPLKEVALVDSTCRSWYGMTPSGSEPGLCGVEQAEKPSGGGKKKGGPNMGFCFNPTGVSPCPNPCQTTCPQSPCTPCVLP